MGYRMQIYRIRAGILHPESEKMQFFVEIKETFLVFKKKALYLYPGSDVNPTDPAGSGG